MLSRSRLVAATSPHVYFLGAGAAQALEFALLQSTQELRLNLQRHVADLVEKQRALVGEFQPSDLLADGAGERSFSWPNNSLSNSPVGIAAQFSFTNVRFLRRL